MRSSYDLHGRSYGRTRATDPRVAEVIWAAVGDARSVANIGAGTGSYEPHQTCVAVEPSSVMVSQRDAKGAPVIQGTAENIALADSCVDAALALLTIHHWDDLRRGIAEMLRVARRRVVIFTWDPEAFAEFWLVRDYLPAAADTDRTLGVGIGELDSAFGGRTVRRIPVPVPSDCLDGFCAAYWRRPEMYLDPTIRAGISSLARTEADHLAPGLAQLNDDLRSGDWSRRYASLEHQDALDVGYHVVVVEV